MTDRRAINPWEWQDQFGFSQALDVDAFMAAVESFGPRMAEARCKPSSTLLEVKGLFHPDAMVELEATDAA